jgi:glycosyltransferase involved in cell wall biosynthesis
MRISFITWYPSCRRSDALAQALGGVSHLIHYLQFKQPLHAPFKYLLQAGGTFRRLRRDRAQVILVASPPVFATIVVWLYCKLAKARYIIDAHTGIFDDPRWVWLLPVSKFLARGAQATIVTNEHLQGAVQAWGAKAVVIGDVPVNFLPVPPAALGPGFHVVVVNTFSQDEPLDEILSAAAALPEVSFHITGNPKHARRNIAHAPSSNVRLTGWLSEAQYTALLRAADAVMCLTTHDHTMQRGAYEAMALEKPLITSRWDVLRKAFYLGTVHVDNTAAEIAAAVQRVRANHAKLTSEMQRLRHERVKAFSGTLKTLQDLINS